MQLSDYDDLPFHQAPTPIATPATSDVHFNDGYIFAAYADDYYLLAGLRLHPNMNVMDGFAVLAHGGEQRCARFSRALRPASAYLSVGPLRVDPAEPMKRLRVSLSESPVDLAFDLEFETVGRPFAETPYRHYRHGHLVNDLMRYTVAVRASGSMTVDGRHVTVDRWHGMRDHSWGVRANMGPRTYHGGAEHHPSEVDHRRFRLWVPFEVAGHSGFFHIHEDEHGRPIDCEGELAFDDGAIVPVAAAEHELEYAPGTRNPVRGRFTLTDTEGVRRDYAIELAGTPADVQGFGYYGGWQDGGAPGVWRGVGPVAESDRYPAGPDIADSGPPALPAGKRLGPTEFPVRITGPDGAKGMGHFEHTVMGCYRPYGFD
ncbi:MAG: hypothetical protein TEF_02715 [Rhizobiales bacterium NRL2]|jgi:hypothetical protein|nr:MAG: hypothetical protein TEF_02715 [Rhizobiales bacterium NRL2]